MAIAATAVSSLEASVPSCVFSESEQVRLGEASEISLLSVATQMSDVRAKIFVVTASYNDYNF